MSSDFETDPGYQAELDWADAFVREEVEPLDHLFPHQLEQFRLLVLRTAWRIDALAGHRKVRKDIAAVKVVMPTVLHDIAWRATQVHGALGTTNEMPFSSMILGAGVVGLADGPTEVHKVTVARQVLRDHRPVEGTWPTGWIPGKTAAAKAEYADLLELDEGNR